MAAAVLGVAHGDPTLHEGDLDACVRAALVAFRHVAWEAFVGGTRDGEFELPR